MKRRLDLALALVHRPRILFLDEPTTGLDPQSRSSLWEEVERLAAEEGMTVFLTTQYLEEADRLADRVGIIDRGQIVAEGTPSRAQGGGRRARASRRRPPIPADRDRLDRGARPLRLRVRGREAATATARVRLAPGCGGPRLGGPRARLRGDRTVADLQLHEPSPRRRLPRARPAASSRAPATATPGRAGGVPRSPRERAARQHLRGRPALVPALDPPAGGVRPGDHLPAVPRSP